MKSAEGNGKFSAAECRKPVFISVAAAFVNVITSISEGLTWQLSIRYFTLPVKTVVLPLPGPAKTRHAPLLNSIALTVHC